MMDENRRGDIAKDAIKIFAGSSNPALARDICAYLGVPVATVETRRFSDGEINVDIQENGSGGSDHGKGGVSLVVGSRLSTAGDVVHGVLDPADTVDGDLRPVIDP